MLFLLDELLEGPCVDEPHGLQSALPDFHKTAVLLSFTDVTDLVSDIVSSHTLSHQDSHTAWCQSCGKASILAYFPHFSKNVPHFWLYFQNKIALISALNRYISLDKFLRKHLHRTPTMTQSNAQPNLNVRGPHNATWLKNMSSRC